jgi:hypothetical protein
MTPPPTANGVPLLLNVVPLTLATVFVLYGVLIVRGMG